MTLPDLRQIDHRATAKLQKITLGIKSNRLLVYYTRLGDGYIWLLVISYMIFYEPALWRGVLHKSFFEGGISFAVYMLIKKMTRRQRPFMRDNALLAKIPALDQYSFPSGHVMNNLVLALLYSSVMPKLGATLILMSLSWGILRIIFGVHYVSDVLAGIVFGVLCFLSGEHLYSLVFIQ